MKEKHKTNSNIIFSVVALVLFILLCFFITKEDIYYTHSYQNDKDNFTYTNVWKKQEINQYFHSSVDELESIQLQLGTYQKKISQKELKLTLLDEEERILRTATVQTEKIKDNQFIIFSFPKLENSKGKRFIMKLQCEECSKEEQIAVYGKRSVEAKEFVQIEENKYEYQTSMILTGKTNFNMGILACFVGIIITSFYLFYKNIKELDGKLGKLLKKDSIIFTIEFMISTGIIYFIYKIMYILNTKYYFQISSFIIEVLLVELLLLLVVYTLKNQKLKVEQFFLFLAIPIGIGYLILIPPTHVADEIVHYTSAYKITNGELKDTGDYVKSPAQIINSGYPNLTSYQRLNALLLEKPTNEMALSTASGYSIINYLPASVGIATGRILNLSYYVGFYLGRVMTLLTSLILGYFSIKRLPIGKLLLCIYMLSPMFLQQAISISADAITNSICIFYISYILYVSQKTEFTKMNKMILSILMFLIAMLKYNYIPIIGLTLLLLFKKKMSKNDKKQMTIIMILAGFLCIALFILHSMVPVKVVTPTIENNVNLSTQLMQLVKHPMSIAKVILNTLTNKGTFYWETFLGGHLGWLNIEIDKVLINIYSFLLLLSPFLIKEKKNYQKQEKIGMIGISFIIFLLTLLAMYLTWTSVGADIIEGVQGRYFLPIIILPLLTLCDKERYLKFKNPYLLSLTILIFVHINVLLTIIYKFL